VPLSYLTTLKERIETKETLSSQAQIALVFELEAGLKEGRAPTEIRELLLSLKRRDDLLAKVAPKIDAALKTLEEKARVQPGKNIGFDTTASGPSTQDWRAGGYRPEQEKFPHYPIELQPEPPPVPTQQFASKAPNAKVRSYTCPSSETRRLIADVRNWLCNQGFDCQQLSTERHGVLLQIKKRGAWRDFVGMSTSLNIVFTQADDTLTVEIGAGKWIDKAVAGAVSIFVLWPLAVTAGLGAWEQTKMPDKVFDYIGSRLSYR